MTEVSINWKKINNYVVLGGSVIIGIGAAMEIMKPGFTFKSRIMPIATVLVAIAAFNTALTAEKGN
jgi:hypothetical protein